MQLFFRYIFTQLSPLAKLIFNPKDDGLLNFLKDDNMRIEPQWWVNLNQVPNAPAPDIVP